jgi:hypothetical protein
MCALRVQLQGLTAASHVTTATCCFTLQMYITRADSQLYNDKIDDMLQLIRLFKVTPLYCWMLLLARSS